MPRLSPDGRAAMGIGAGPGSVDRQTIVSPGGGLCWLTADTCLAQTQIDGQWCLVALPRTGGAMQRIGGPANDLCAGGNRFLAWANGVGVFGSLSRPQAGLRGAGPDGTLAYCPDYQSGLGLVLNSPDGTDWPVPGVGYSLDVQVISPGAAIWFDGQTHHACGVSAPRPALRAGRLRRVALPSGEVWLVYWAEGTGLVAQVDGAQEGYVLEPLPIAFNHDATAVGDALTVAWSVTQGEGPEDLRVLQVDRTQPRIPLRPAALVLPQIGRPLWIGAFEFDQALGCAPGNCLLAVRHWGGRLARPAIVTHETLASVSGQILGQFLGGSSVGDIEAAAQDAAARPIVYWDARAWPRYPRLPDGSWVCLQAYQRADESLAAFEADLRRLLAAAPPRPIALVCQSYTSNPSQATDLVSQIPVYLRLARDHPDVVALLRFSGYGRAGGEQDHPEIQAIWQRVVADTATPAWEPEEPPEPPDSPPTPQPPQEPMPPSFDQWIRLEYPQLVAAYQYGHPLPDGRPGTDRPGDEWAAFQTLRRYSGFIPGMGEAWTLPQMIAHERSLRPADAPADPSEPP